VCGRFSVADPARIRRAFPRYRFEEFSEYRLPRFNVAPTQSVLGVRDAGGERVEVLRWGVDGRINARAETLAKRAVPRRCVLFADGFYEWRGKIPYRFTLPDDEPFALAGVWEPSTVGAPDFEIVTCAPNELVREFHNRMPVVLPPAALDAWLSPHSLAGAEAERLLQPYAADAMRVALVSTRLNDAAYDAPDVLLANDPVQQSLF
jgi:putative SOS response-associated peptidase YedK